MDAGDEFRRRFLCRDRNYVREDGALRGKCSEPVFRRSAVPRDATEMIVQRLIRIWQIFIGLVVIEDFFDARPCVIKESPFQDIFRIGCNRTSAFLQRLQHNIETFADAKNRAQFVRDFLP